VDDFANASLIRTSLRTLAVLFLSTKYLLLPGFYKRGKDSFSVRQE